MKKGESARRKNRKGGELGAGRPAVKTGQLLDDLPRRLQKLYGPRLKGLWLFGSFARGQEREGSDLDVAMVLEGVERPWPEIERTGQLASELSLAHGVTLSLIPIQWRDWERGEKPLVRAIRKEGMAIQ